MANQEHIGIFEKGTEIWNQWREGYPDIQPDLSNTNFSKRDLREFDLSKVNFYGANLSNAILDKVDLSRGRLSLANLNGAHLRKAVLNTARLRMTFLNGADLREAILDNAYLDKAYLDGANLQHARMHWTTIADTNLAMVKGLELVNHDGLSTIGLDTIYLSKGQITDSFLRGAGVPEPFIANMRALVDSMSPTEFYSCFISYSHQNEDFAKRLHADLQAQGVRCWFAEEDLKIGDHYHQRIDEAIRLYDKLILVLSDAAVRSAWVEREVVAAREKEDHQQREMLFPLRLDDAVMETNQAWAADVRRRWHIGDFTCWKDHDSYQQAFERLLRDLKAEAKGGSNG